MKLTHLPTLAALTLTGLACGPGDSTAAASEPLRAETATAPAGASAPAPLASPEIADASTPLPERDAMTTEAVGATLPARTVGERRGGSDLQPSAPPVSPASRVATEPEPQLETAAPATAIPSTPPTAAPGSSLGSPPSHAPFSALLKRYVSAAGQVDYAGLRGDAEALRAYLGTLAQNPPTDDWSRDERLAYWINAYNAATLRLIVDNYPVAKITDLDGGKPWDVKRVELGDATYSLNQIENEIIRPRFGEPRIHFAVNCAAASCPPLRNEAYVASKLDAQLEEQTRAFVNDARYNRLSGASPRVSKIFDWYGEDFGDLRAFLARYARGGVAAGEIGFADYNWALNGK